jgi:L-aminopeptidase/D-esterase-like protein
MRKRASRARAGLVAAAVAVAVLGLRAGPSGAAEGTLPGGSLTDVAGVKVGQFTDTRRPTGVTVVLVERGAICGVDVRGGAPGTRETDLLDPRNLVDRVHGVVLAGGSAFGLDAATGVVRYLEEKGVGFPTGAGPVPIVPAAVLYDLLVGDPKVRPDAAAGYEAARTATPGPVLEGSIGAGAGATVGKLFGFGSAMASGLGTASLRLPNRAVVAALVAVNAVGDVVDPATGQVVAGARAPEGRGFRRALDALAAGRPPGAPLAGQNTTLAVVATNVVLNKAQAGKVAQMAHDGLARAIHPVHTPWDGDVVFALSTGEVALDSPDLVVGSLAAEVLSRAVLRAVRAARGRPGLPAAADPLP